MSISTPNNSTLVHRSIWDPTKTYYYNDIVLYNGSTYQSLMANNQGNEPDITPSAWTPWPPSPAVVTTKLAPVNVTNPAFGADPTGTVDSTAAINAAITFAITANPKNGYARSVFLPAGIYNITSRLKLKGALGLKIYGEGPYATVIQQNTNNEPIIESDFTGNLVDSCYGLEISDLQLIYQSQQAYASNSSAACIRLIGDNQNGFFFGKYRNLNLSYGCWGIQWGPNSLAGGAYNGAMAFWNNTVDNVYCYKIAGAVLKNSNGVATGSPTNWCSRLTHQAQAPGQGSDTACINLGSGMTWEFRSLDIEDWTDRIFFATGSTDISIAGMHVERLHAVTSNIRIVEIDESNFDIRRMDFSVYRDGTGPYYLFGFGGVSPNFSEGYCGSWRVNTYSSGNLGSGSISGFTIPDNSILPLGAGVVIGPRTTNDTTNYVDWFTFDTTTPLGLRSDQGLPPVWYSTNALPAASVSYRGRQLLVKGANASTTDQLVVCLQNDQGAYSWVPLQTSVRSGTATLAAGTSGSIADTKITASSLIRLTNIGAGGTVGALSVALAAGTGFTINSTSNVDTSKVFWEIVSY